MSSYMGRNASVTTTSGIIAELGEWTLDIETELIEEPVFGNNGWNRVHGNAVTAYGGTLTGLFDQSDTNGQIYLYNAMINSTILTDVWFYTTATDYYKPDTVTSADAGLYIASYSVTANTADVLRIEMSYRGNGPIILTS